MKHIVWFILAIVALGFVWTMYSKEKFEVAFFDTTQEKKRAAVEDSSYAQQTNHVEPSPYSSGPIPGQESPFRVNQFNAYVT
jgi:hypothetical protein